MKPARPVSRPFTTRSGSKSAHRREPHAAHVFRCAAWMVALSGAVLAPAAPAQPDRAQPDRAQPDRAWDGAFTRESGWNGGDIGHAIDLGDGRTLWLFGDSIVGPVRDGARVGAESVMVRGAIAWHETPMDGSPPEEIRFAIPDPGHGLPVAPWTRANPELWPGDAWHWLMGDGRLITDADGEPRFVLFATVIGPSGNPDGVWDFRRIGGSIIHVENPGDAPAEWRASQRGNPLVTETPGFGEPPRVGENWGLAIIAWPAGAPSGPRTLYVYGVRASGPADVQLLVARCAEPDLPHPERWAFFDGSGWSDRAEDAAALAMGLMDEFTVQPVSRDGRVELVLVQSEPMLGRRILVRTARSPEGPWSEPRAVFTVAEPAADDRLITYAAKGHAHLSRDGELLVSYVINSLDFGQIFREPSLYRPRFVRVPLGELPHPPEE